MKTILLSLVIMMIGEASVLALPKPGAPVGPHPGPGVQQGMVLQGSYLKAYGIPFLASTAPGDAILQGAQGVGSTQQANQEIYLRAQQLCSYYGYGNMMNYVLDRATYSQFVVINNQGQIVYAPQALINPFQVGYITGYARAFARIRCAR